MDANTCWAHIVEIEKRLKTLEGKEAKNGGTNKTGK